MEIILQVLGAIFVAFLLFKLAPFIFNSIFKLSVIIIGIVFVLIIYSLLITDWSVTYV